MIDREKIVKWLEDLLGFLFRKYGNVQADEANTYCEYFLAVDNAIKVLKEQEPVKPTHDDSGNVYCGNCGENVGYIPKYNKHLPTVKMHYCPECGRKVD